MGDGETYYSGPVALVRAAEAEMRRTVENFMVSVVVVVVGGWWMCGIC